MPAKSSKYSAPQVPRVTHAAAAWRRPSRALGGEQGGAGGQLVGQDPAAALTDGGDVGGHLGAEGAQLLALQHQPRPGPLGEGRLIVSGLASPLSRPVEPGMLGEQLPIATDADHLAEYPHVDGLATVADGTEYWLPSTRTRLSRFTVATRYSP